MNGNTQVTNNVPTALPKNSSNTQEWKGLTLDELKMRRAKSLVRREISRMSLAHQFDSTKNNLSQNGIRGLLFSNNTISGLKKADYAFLGYKAVALLVRLYLRRKRR